MNNLCTAMVGAFADIEGATKDKKNPAFKSTYADLSSVVDAIKPALVKHGLFFAQITHEMSGGVCVETVVLHSSGEQMSFGKLFVPATKQDAQGYGSALTYCRRYSLMAAFGVAPEDDDGNAASRQADNQSARQDRAPRNETKVDDIEPAGGWGDWTRWLIAEVAKAEGEFNLDEMKNDPANKARINAVKKVDGAMFKAIGEAFTARRAVLADQVPF